MLVIIMFGIYKVWSWSWWSLMNFKCFLYYKKIPFLQVLECYWLVYDLYFWLNKILRFQCLSRKNPKKKNLKLLLFIIQVRVILFRNPLLCLKKEAGCFKAEFIKVFCCFLFFKRLSTIIFINNFWNVKKTKSLVVVCLCVVERGTKKARK